MAWHSTRAPNIAIFVHISGDAFPDGDLSRLPDGPTALERAAHRARVVAEIVRADGNVVRSMIETVSDFRLAAAKAGFEYPVLEGRDLIVSALTDSLKYIDTTHSVSNPRVSVRGDTARLDALLEAQHVLQNDQSRHYLMKNRYDVELVRDDDIWRIKRVTVDNVWRSGDPAVLAGV